MIILVTAADCDRVSTWFHTPSSRTPQDETVLKIPMYSDASNCNQLPSLIRLAD